MKTRFMFLFLLAYFVLTSQLTATEIENKFRHIMQLSAEEIIDPPGIFGSPGLVIGLVSEQGEVVEGFGSRFILRQIRPDENTFFGIGSVTKIFTGLMLANAVINNQLNLNDPVNSILDIKANALDGVTLQQLVTHYSGLPNFPDNIKQFRDLDHDGQNDSIPASPARNYSQEMLLDTLSQKNQNQAQPGTKYQYSNLGIAILGMALEKKLHFSNFNDMLDAQILHPLKMVHTSTHTSTFVQEARAQMAKGYMLLYRRIHPVDFSEMGLLRSSGEMITTAKDMQILLRCLTGIISCPLRAAVIEAMRPLAPTDYDNKIGYAIDIHKSRDGGTLYSKAGITTGYTAMVMWRQTPKIGIVILANRGHLEKLRQASIQLFELLTEQLNPGQATPRTSSSAPAIPF
ncbi:MAG: beta-lactamase family protein [Magnetococcus sp. DMHC-6]